MCKNIQRLLEKKPVNNSDKVKNTIPTITAATTADTHHKPTLTITTQFETKITNESIIKRATIKRPTNTSSNSSITITRHVRINDPEQPISIGISASAPKI